MLIEVPIPKFNIFLGRGRCTDGHTEVQTNWQTYGQTKGRGGVTFHMSTYHRWSFVLILIIFWWFYCLKSHKINWEKKNHLRGNFWKFSHHWPTWMLHPLTTTYLTSRSESFAMAQKHRHTNKYTNKADSGRNPPRGPIRWKQLQQCKFSLLWLHTWLCQLIIGITKVFL